MRAVVIRLLFVPTLLWNLLLARLLRRRRWWDRVDEHLVLGGLPFPGTADELAREGVRAVVNTCLEYGGPVRRYAAHGIEQLRVPTLDFTPPSLEHVRAAVAFIERHVARGESVYVHCKAGRGRSATVALCWLVAHRGISPRAAQDVLAAARPHVNPGVWQRAVVAEFVAGLAATASPTDR